MDRCSGCGVALEAGSTRCVACGSARHVSTATVSPPVALTSDPSPHEEGMLPGTLLAGRYRVVALLGRGGMGEVYRVEDVRLGQSVALKFLPDALAMDPAGRARFLGEVRLGRTVAHPNVCRIYDLAEVAGRLCLTMEFIDGEDLASLVTRIGRLPPDKAVEVAREICAGLGAVHDQGIVHRDLKPANVMIDGRGRARLSDFGIAARGDEVGHEAFAGTPAYMAPEQHAGETASTASDIYALGLVMFELFTGQRCADARRGLDPGEAADASLRSDPGAAALPAGDVRDLVSQCLQRDPARRPASAAEVLARLPGGDPLAAALAAGETPTPEMVAAVALRGDITPRVAWAALVASLVALLLLGAMQRTTSQIGTLRHAVRSPDVLAERAREVRSLLEWQADVADEAAVLVWRGAQATDAAPKTPWAVRADRYPGALRYHWRESPAPLIATHFPLSLMSPAEVGRVQPQDPPLTRPGMATIELDHRGRLVAFTGVPPRELGAERETPFDWTPVFAAAGLAIADYQATAPILSAPVDSDRKWAWQRAGQTPARIEAATLRGRPVWFSTERPLAPDAETRATGADHLVLWLAVIISVAMIVPLVRLTLRNLRQGRSDRRGALRLAIFVAIAVAIALVLRADHGSDLQLEASLLTVMLMQAVHFGVGAWIAYIAFEPLARRRWPHLLVGWQRLLAGRWRDSLVGRNVLQGVVVGIGMALMLHAGGYVSLLLDPSATPLPAPATVIASLRHYGHFALLQVQLSITITFGAVLMVLLLRALVRWTALAHLLVAAVVFAVFFAFAGGVPAVFASSAAVALAWLLVLWRWGILAAALALWTFLTLFCAPPILALLPWTADRAWVAFAAIATLAVLGARHALAGKSLWSSSLLDRV